MTNKDTITKANSCETDYDPNSLSVEEAQQRILKAVQPVQLVEKIALRSALNRVLAEDIFSSFFVPGHDNSAMDGYAFAGAARASSEQTIQLRMVGTAWAGRPFPHSVKHDECVRIMTGAVMPSGTDTVVLQESVERQGDVIRFDVPVKIGDNVRTAGEDLQQGELVLSAGRYLDPADLGLLASLGVVEVPVLRRIRVAFFSTGDELRTLGEPLELGQIYDSNRYTLYAMLTQFGAEIHDLGVIRDQRAELEQAFKCAASNADVVIVSGGASVGEADFIQEVLATTGQIDFWKVAMKPGRPLAFGRIGNAAFFGLPGNPVSVMVTFYQFVLPALRRIRGEQEVPTLTFKAMCTGTLRKKPGRTEYQRGILENDAEGRLTVRSTGMQGSGILSSMSQANCFIILPQDTDKITPGSLVDVQPFYSLR